ncbi:hypothetical protein GOBAR_DD33827 [Gossypium barbadense]|nr:hypothetical protein GOBAR_DD33827 [Gossypium barbadense]
MPELKPFRKFESCPSLKLKRPRLISRDIKLSSREGEPIEASSERKTDGATETLKLNMALILLPVCRNIITWLKNKTKLGAVVPFDDNLNFHKTASCHEYEPIEKYFREQAKSYWHFVKHIEGVTRIIIVVLMAFAFTLATPMFRRGRMKLPKPLEKFTGFNAFWYSHHLFVIVSTPLIVHGIKLFLTKKWHPFSITSAPGDDYVSVHIRTLGFTFKEQETSQQLIGIKQSEFIIK